MEGGDSSSTPSTTVQESLSKNSDKTYFQHLDSSLAGEPNRIFEYEFSTNTLTPLVTSGAGDLSSLNAANIVEHDGKVYFQAVSSSANIGTEYYVHDIAPGTNELFYQGNTGTTGTFYTGAAAHGDYLYFVRRINGSVNFDITKVHKKTKVATDLVGPTSGDTTIGYTLFDFDNNYIMSLGVFGFVQDLIFYDLTTGSEIPITKLWGANNQRLTVYRADNHDDYWLYFSARDNGDALSESTLYALNLKTREFVSLIDKSSNFSSINTIFHSNGITSIAYTLDDGTTHSTLQFNTQSKAIQSSNLDFSLYTSIFNGFNTEKKAYADLTLSDVDSFYAIDLELELETFTKVMSITDASTNNASKSAYPGSGFFNFEGKYLLTVADGGTEDIYLFDTSDDSATLLIQGD